MKKKQPSLTGKQSRAPFYNYTHTKPSFLPPFIPSFLPPSLPAIPSFFPSFLPTSQKTKIDKFYFRNNLLYLEIPKKSPKFKNVMDGRTNQWMDGWADGWTNQQSNVELRAHDNKGITDHTH